MREERGEVRGGASPGSGVPRADGDGAGMGASRRAGRRHFQGVSPDIRLLPARPATDRADESRHLRESSRSSTRPGSR